MIFVPDSLFLLLRSLDPEYSPHLLEYQDGFSCRSCNHMSSSYLPMFCFIKYNLLIVYHVQILYCSMFFLLTRVVQLPSYPVFRTRYWLFTVVSIKARKPGKYCSTSSFVFSLLVILYSLCGIGKHCCLINPSIFCMSLHTLLWSNPNKNSVKV